MRAAGQDIISLGVGGPDQPPHPKVIARLAAESAKPGTHAYQPYKGTAILREAFARWYNRFYGVTLDPVTEVLPLIGSKEGIMHVCMTYLNPGDKVLIPNPGYPTYRSAATIAGGVCVDYLLREQLSAQSRVKRIAEMAEEAGVPCETVVAQSTKPNEEIVRIADEHDCDCIFMASHGRKGLNKLFIGSETQKVLATAHVPVLVYR